jgi:ribonuclease P/MRP protein subunit POP5
MVRIKHRYLLFNILYPSDDPSSAAVLPGQAAPASSTSSASKTEPPPPYILFSRPSPAHLTSQLLLSTLRNSIQSLFGDHGLSVTQASLRVVYFSPSTSTAILRVPRAHFRLVWASLTFMDTIPGEQLRNQGASWRGGGGRGKPSQTMSSTSSATLGPAKCVVRVVRVSGTIRKSEDEVLRRARRELVRARREGREVVADEVADDRAVLEGLLGGGQARGQSKSLRVEDEEEEEEDGIEDLDEDEDDYD